MQSIRIMLQKMPIWKRIYYILPNERSKLQTYSMKILLKNVWLCVCTLRKILEEYILKCNHGYP